MTLTLYMWHDAVHEALEGARLNYWRFSFAPEYEREAVLEKIPKVLRSHDIRSYILYETFGDYDVMLRLWAPPRDLNPEDLALTFEDALSGLNLHQLNYLAVQKTYLHWVWQDVTAENLELTRPEPTALTNVTNDKVLQLATLGR